MQDNDWSSTHNYDYWNKNFTTSVGLVNTPTLKTIYDPAISGFVEPMTSAFTNFTTNGSNTTNSSQFNVSGVFNRGWYFYTIGWKFGATIFLNALGFRDTYSGRDGTGTIAYFDSYGNYWSAGASSLLNSLYLDFYSSYIAPQYAFNRSHGFTSQPVLE